MIDYETYCKIRDHRDRQGLSITQTAQALGIASARRSRSGRASSSTASGRGVKRGSQLDPYKGQIVRWLDSHPYSAQQIFQRLREAGYTRRDDHRQGLRAPDPPAAQKAFLKLSFAPGECAQVDWGEYGTIAVGITRRKLSFFVMVLCYWRQMYVEFTVSQTMEHFLACHENAFAVLGVPEKIMVDNLKSAVLQAPGRRGAGVEPALRGLRPPSRLQDRALQRAPPGGRRAAWRTASATSRKTS